MRMIGRRRRWPGPKSFHVVNHFESKIRNEKTFVKFFFYFFLLSLKLFTGSAGMVQDEPSDRMSRDGPGSTGQDGRDEWSLSWSRSRDGWPIGHDPPDRMSGPGSTAVPDAVQDGP